MDRSNQPLAWRKSRRSTAGENCVEVANLPAGGMAVRDSKNPTGPTLSCGPAEWRAFTSGIKGGQLA